MENLALRVTDIKTHCCDIKTFRLTLDREISFKPGQYLILTLRVGEKDVSKPLSISSSPTERGYIEFTKKITTSDFSKKLDSAVKGDPFSVRLPAGRFTFEGEFGKAAFLSGGIGITPIRSILKYATDKRISSSLVLLYSGRTPEQLIFKEDFESMQKKNPHLKTVYTLTDCEQVDSYCRTGRINEEMIKSEIPDFRERRFYICGPPAMVSAMRAILTDKLNLPNDNIITEDFFGY